eukprot:2318506-Prymnesium_polylepis.1
MMNQEGEQSSRVRPLAKLFRPDEIQRLGGDVTGPHRTGGGREYFGYDGAHFEDGCLIKTMSTRGLRWGDDIVPSLAEVGAAPPAHLQPARPRAHRARSDGSFPT